MGGKDAEGVSNGLSGEERMGSGRRQQRLKNVNAQTCERYGTSNQCPRQLKVKAKAKAKAVVVIHRRHRQLKDPRDLIA